MDESTSNTNSHLAKKLENLIWANTPSDWELSFECCGETMLVCIRAPFDTNGRFLYIQFVCYMQELASDQEDLWDIASMLTSSVKQVIDSKS